MNPSRFDAIAKSVASQPSRRQMLRLFSGGGLLAAAGFGGRAAVAAAQSQTCTLAFNGAIRLGPSASELIAGGKTAGALAAQLTFGIDARGTLSQGRLQLADGTSFPFVGQATGRALNARVDFGNGLVLVAVGTADQDVTACQGKIDGLLTGPQTGDLGDWHGALGGEGSAGNLPAASPTSPATAAAAANVSECDPGQTVCSGLCADLASDSNNCGTCGHACAGSQTCSNGTCQAST